MSRPCCVVVVLAQTLLRNVRLLRRPIANAPLALGRKEQGPTMLARNFTVRQLQLAMAGPVSGDNILAITIRAFDKGDAQICACRRLVQDSTST